MLFPDKNKTLLLSGILLGIIIVCVIFINYISVPAQKGIKAVKNDIDQINQEIAAKQRNSLKLPELEKELQSLQTCFSDSTQNYISEHQLSSTINSMVDEKLIGQDVTIVDYKPREIEDYNSIFKRQAFSLKMTADYAGLVRYCMFLLNSDKGISFTTIEATPGDETGDFLNIAINGHVYAIKDNALKQRMNIPNTKPVVHQTIFDAGISNIFFNIFQKKPDIISNDTIVIDTTLNRERERQEFIQKVASLNIQGIWIGKNKRVLIDNTIYTEGDYVNAMMISVIRSNQVEFVSNGITMIKMLSVIK